MSESKPPVGLLSARQRQLFALLLQEQGLKAAPAQTIPRRTTAGPSVLSFAQQRLWFISQLAGESPLYNLPGGMRFVGRLDIAALERALSEIVRRHEVLRTTFTVLDGQPLQRVSEAGRFALNFVDLSQQPEAGRRAEVERLARYEAEQPFDLERGPLVRAALARLGEEEHILLYTIHHIISDGWSVDILSQEVSTLYTAYVAGRPSPLPELEIQYADFAAWQREWLKGEVLAEQLAYWKRQLGGETSPLELPFDHPRPPVQTYRGAGLPFTLSPELSRGLRELSRREGVTLFMTLLSGYAALLYRLSGQERVAVGTPVAGRWRRESEPLIGFFVNTLVVRADLSGEVTFKGLLGRVRETCLGAYAHQDVPFERLVEELQPERSLAHTPLFQSWFVLRLAPTPMLQLPGLQVTPYEVEHPVIMFDLMLSLVDTGDALKGELKYNVDLFEEETAAGMLEYLKTLLHVVSERPDICVLDIPLEAEGPDAPGDSGALEPQFSF